MKSLPKPQHPFVCQLKATQLAQPLLNVTPIKLAFPAQQYSMFAGTTDANR